MYNLICIASRVSEPLKESVERDARRQELQKQIAALQVKVRRERQLNKQVELNGRLKILKRELEELCWMNIKVEWTSYAWKPLT